jgi:hypothetical protein
MPPELARVEVHAEIYLPEHATPDKVALPPPDERVLLSSATSFSPT